MDLYATIANGLWVMSNLVEARKFHKALRCPETVQLDLLRSYIGKNSDSAYGRAHRFAEIHNYKEFAQRVPIVDYDDLEPWISRIKQGENQVLTQERVTHLVPTSGSSGARKLIPFTAGFQIELNRAIAPWVVDLFRSHPSFASGCAYWSVSPVLQNEEIGSSAVPVGFDDDSFYLGGARKKLVQAVMAVPPEVRWIQDVEAFRYVTLLCLLRRKDLSFISIWHPSFLSLLFDVLPKYWDQLIDDIQSGSCFFANSLPQQTLSALELRPMSKRARQLEQANPHESLTIWPSLKAISCWGDMYAELALLDLKKRIPRLLVQPKGLLATEAFVTIPFDGFYPLAVRSHFFEFIDSQNRVLLGHELAKNEIYEVVITTAGGLWRYRLYDRIQVTGFLGKTPCFRFIGRSGNVSDYFGEKMSEAFVASVIQRDVMTLKSAPSFILLAPDSHNPDGIGYTLYIEGDVFDIPLEGLERSLRANPHYALCRDLGQLQELRVFRIESGGYETFMAQETKRGKKIGEIKPLLLSRETSWSRVFRGNYLEQKAQCSP